MFSDYRICFVLKTALFGNINLTVVRATFQKYIVYEQRIIYIYFQCLSEI